MIIKLLSMQIPKFWEPIKFTIKTVDGVDEKDLQATYNELLHALLNDKAQCFIRLTDERVLVAVGITRVMLNKITGDKYLSLREIYSWKKHEESEWEEWKELLIKFAKQEKCKSLRVETRVEKMIQILESRGFVRSYTVLDLPIRQDDER